VVMLVVFHMSCSHGDEKLSVLSAPAGNHAVAINKAGITVIPNGRFLTPAGRSVEVAPHPYGLAISDDMDVAVTANSGVSPISISIIKGLLSGRSTVIQVPPGARSDQGILASVFMGLAISQDKKLVYVAGGQTNKIYIFSIADGSKVDSVDCGMEISMPRFRDIIGFIVKGDLYFS